MNVIAIESNAGALQNLKDYCRRVAYIKLQKTFNEGEAALNYIRKFPVDVCIIEMNMPTVADIEIYKKLGETARLIFTSNYAAYAVEAFNLIAVDYLLKPFSFERFQTAFSKAKKYFDVNDETGENINNDHLFVRADYRLIKINFRDIFFIEGLVDYLKIHLATDKMIVARLTMKSLSEKLLTKNFIRVHRSNIVPLHRIESVRNRSISIKNNIIPIGSRYQQNFFNVLTPHAFAS